VDVVHPLCRWGLSAYGTARGSFLWGTDRFVTPRSVDVYVRRLREKIESDPENPIHLKTVRGAGYLFETRAA